MNPLFSWVHLSDLHAGHGSPSHQLDQHLVLEQLRHDIEHRPPEVPAPDVILITGDVASSAGSRGPGEYALARQWLHECARLLGLGPEAVFIVPGNHDVDRRVANKYPGLIESLRSGSRSVDEVLASQKDRKALRRRFAAFESFATEFAHVDRDERFGLAWSHRYTGRDGLTVRLAGLNTALLSQDDRDSGALRLGKGQIVGALLEPQFCPDDLVIALAHHSFSLLADGVEAERCLRNYVHIFLNGHMHRADSRLIARGGGNEAVTITAGAVHGDENEAVVYGYSFGAVFGKPGAALELRVWPRAWSRENQDFRLDVDNAPRDKSFARFRLRPTLLAAARAVPTHVTPIPTPPAPPPITTMLQYKPPLAVYVVWHPAFVAGKLYAEGLFGLLARDVAAPLSQGLGIPVFFRSVSTEPCSVPIDINFEAAKRTAVVALLDDELLSNSAWRMYLTGLAEKVQASGRGRFFLPVAFSRNALLLEKASGLHFVRLDLQPPEAQVEYLEASVLHALCRRLAQVSEPAQGAAPAPLKVFLSHAKKDGHEAAKEIQSRLQSPHGLESFYDTEDMPHGFEFDREIDCALNDTRTVLLAIQTDTFASRGWCRREVLRAKEHGRPVLVIDALRVGEARSFPYMGNVPTVRWAPENSVFWRVLLRELLVEALRFLYVPEELTALADLCAPGWCPLALPHAPEALTFLHRLKNHPPPKEMKLVVYPDPPMAPEELALVQTPAPTLIFATPATLYVCSRS